MALDLTLPAHLTSDQRLLLSELAARRLDDHAEDFLGLVLTGSSGRGMATSRSDLDVVVVLSDEVAAAQRTARSSEVDEIPASLTELGAVAAFGTEDWWFRWSFAWAPVLLDRTGGTLSAAVHRQATVTWAQADSILIEHDRLDGWLNFAYRSLKSDRDGRLVERRLDAAESVPWLLDVIWSMAGRVRPYNKYLAWELRTHPLPGWDAEEVLDLVERTLDGDPDAVRETFVRIEVACQAYDSDRGHTRTTDMIEGWGDELDLLRGIAQGVS